MNKHFNVSKIEKGIGERIRKCRESKGLSQQQLGDEIGVAQNTISNYECGRSVPSTLDMMKLVELFDTSYIYLYEGIEFNTEDIARGYSELSFKKKHIWDAIASSMLQVLLREI